MSASVLYSDDCCEVSSDGIKIFWYWYRLFAFFNRRLQRLGAPGIGTRHALGLVGDERVTLVAGCDDGYVCPPVRSVSSF